MRDGKFKIINWRGFFGVWGPQHLERAPAHVRLAPLTLPSGAAYGSRRLSGSPSRWSPGNPPSNQYDRFDAADIGLVESGCPARRWQVVSPDTRFLITEDKTMAVTIQDLALEASTARTKAEAHLNIVSRALDEAEQQEEQARIIRDDLLADLAHRLDDLAEDDAVGRAHLALDLAEINDSYRQAANALGKAEDALADAERDLKAAMADVEKYPIPAPEP